jgi:hypothetical protein
MRVHVYEAGGHPTALGVDHLCAFGVEIVTHGRDPSVFYK